MSQIFGQYQDFGTQWHSIKRHLRLNRENVTNITQ